MITSRLLNQTYKARWPLWMQRRRFLSRRWLQSYTWPHQFPCSKRSSKVAQGPCRPRHRLTLSARLGKPKLSTSWSSATSRFQFTKAGEKRWPWRGKLPSSGLTRKLILSQVMCRRTSKLLNKIAYRSRSVFRNCNKRWSKVSSTINL